jgi:hypothetical protein
MHDCFGKPLKPFDRVRAATQDELDAAHGFRTQSRAGFDGEKVIVACNANCETCNVQIVDSVGAPIVLLGSDGGSGIAAYPFSGPIRYATARTLVKTEA